MSKKTLDNLKESAYAEQEGYVFYKAPAEDLRMMEKLLDLSPAALGGEHLVKLSKGSERCLQCGRHFSFLEVINAEISYHGTQLLRDVLMGKYGYINNRRPPQMFNCYQCGKAADKPTPFYWCPIYGG